uniref:Oxysterol-binding protein n=1 Tax=Apteryx owenii TaxID=8824 RepID=A0A8B9QFP9_APTOW
MGSHEKDPASPKRAPSRSNSTVSSKHSSVQQGSESWELVDDPRARGSPGQEPERHEGYLLKKRKWPLKGWHKVLKGKLHGSIDVRQSVMSVNKKAQRVDLDTEENIYHLKIKSPELFSSWVSSLCSHHQGERPDPLAGPRGGPGSWTRILPSGSAPALSTLASSRDKVNAWLKDSEGLERCSAELSECQAKLQELNDMLQSLESLHRIPSAPLISNSQPSAATERPKKGKRTTRIWCTQSFAKDDTIGRVGRLHGSVPNLSRYLEPCQSQLPFSLPPEYSQLQRSFWILAQKGGMSRPPTASPRRWPRLREPPASREVPGRGGGLGAAHGGWGVPEPGPRPAAPCPAGAGEPELPPLQLLGPGAPRRSCLPAPHVHAGDVSLWNILRNNIGKDLSKVSMPVQLNEPLNTLQRLCEELEYSALLDRASRCPDPCQRLVYVAAFAVSAYASTYYRAGSKPFNPVLGETYECVRPDRGFRFISEQVCHHPPISACHAESDNFIFWQDMKWKNKFWGKSLEIVPMGTVNVRLPRSGDHFEWNKVTTCIHNILSGPRWIEHYGEVLIRNTRDASYHCKITFCKARYWGSSVNEVQGAVLSRSGKVVERLAGKWHEGLFRGPAPGGQCVWRANPMPRDHERNYGFTQFALELNELTPELKRVLPSTDTRLRPDQRYLEEGNVPAAETQKRQIEQLQRDRRRVMEENNIAHQARFFRFAPNTLDGWMDSHTHRRTRTLAMPHPKLLL